MKRPIQLTEPQRRALEWYAKPVSQRPKVNFVSGMIKTALRKKGLITSPNGGNIVLTGKGLCALRGVAPGRQAGFLTLAPLHDIDKPQCELERMALRYGDLAAPEYDGYVKPYELHRWKSVVTLNGEARTVYGFHQSATEPPARWYLAGKGTKGQRIKGAK